MTTVGIRELKQSLSQYMRKVKSGESIIITERRKEIALITPINAGRNHEKVIQLIQSGIARWSGGKPKGLESRIVSRGKTVSSAVIEDRR